NRGSLSLLHVQAFGAVETPTMPSADFCPSITAPLDAASTSRQIDRPPRVMHTHLHAYTRRIYDHGFRTSIGLRRYSPSHPAQPPRMRFLFVGPALCLRLPSDLTSR